MTFQEEEELKAYQFPIKFNSNLPDSLEPLRHFLPRQSIRQLSSLPPGNDFVKALNEYIYSRCIVNECLL